MKIQKTKIMNMAVVIAVLLASTMFESGSQSLPQKPVQTTSASLMIKTVDLFDTVVDPVGTPVGERRPKVKEDRDELAALVEMLQERLDRLESENSRLSEDVDLLNHSLESQRQINDSLDKRVDDLEAVKSKLSKYLKKLE